MQNGPGKYDETANQTWYVSYIPGEGIHKIITRGHQYLKMSQNNY